MTEDIIPCFSLLPKSYMSLWHKEMGTYFWKSTLTATTAPLCLLEALSSLNKEEMECSFMPPLLSDMGRDGM